MNSSPLEVVKPEVVNAVARNNFVVFAQQFALPYTIAPYQVELLDLLADAVQRGERLTLGT